MSASVLRLGFEFGHDPPLHSGAPLSTPGPHPYHQLPTAVLSTRPLLFVCSPYILSSQQNHQGDLDFFLKFSPSSCRFISKLSLVSPSYETVSSKDFLSSHFDRLEELTIVTSGNEGYFEDESVVVNEMGDVDEVFAKRKRMDGNCLNCLTTMGKYLRVLLLDGFDTPSDLLISAQQNVSAELFRPISCLKDTLEVFKLSTNETVTVNPLITEYLKDFKRLTVLHFYSCRRVGKVVVDDENDDSLLQDYDLGSTSNKLRSFAFSDVCHFLRPEFFKILLPQMPHLEYLDLNCELNDHIYRPCLYTAGEMIYLNESMSNNLRSLFLNCEALNSDLLYLLAFGVKIPSGVRNEISSAVRLARVPLSPNEACRQELVALFERLDDDVSFISSLRNIRDDDAVDVSSVRKALLNSPKRSALCQVLELLHLHNYNNLSSAGVIAGLSMFERLSDLVLDLYEGGWSMLGGIRKCTVSSSSAIRAISEALTHTTNPKGLEHLTISNGYSLEIDALAELAPCIREHRGTLRTLNLEKSSSLALNDEVVEKLFAVYYVPILVGTKSGDTSSKNSDENDVGLVGENTFALEELHFAVDANPISDKSMNILGKLHFKNLQKLDFSNCFSLTTAGLDALCSNPTIQSSLISLIIEQCREIDSILPLLKLRMLNFVNISLLNDFTPVSDYEKVFYDATTSSGSLFHLNAATMRYLPGMFRKEFEELFKKIRNERPQLNIQYRISLGLKN